LMVEWSREQLPSYSILRIDFEGMIPIATCLSNEKKVKKEGILFLTLALYP